MNEQHAVIMRQQVTLFPKIEYSKELFEDKQDGLQCAYILRICHGADIRLDTVMSPDGCFRLQEPSVSARACRKEHETLIGVVNADFFYMTNGAPQGAAVMSGKIIKEEMRDHTHFFGIYQDGAPVIGDKETFLNTKQSLKMAVSGRDILVDGDTLPEPVLEPKPSRHPRTAVCICENGDLLLVVIDGRNPGVAEGLYLDRFGIYLKSLGAKKALNLDGGGSSVMSLRMPGQPEAGIVNVPSDGMERPCANGIAMFAQHMGDGLLQSAYITPQQEYIAPGTRLTLSAHGVDSLLGPCTLPEDITFSVPADSECTVSADGTFIAAPTECDVTVSVSAGKQLLGTALLHVRTPDTLHASASCICTEGEVHELNVTATRRGCTVLTNSTSFNFTACKDIGWFDDAGRFHAKNEVCEADVLISAKNNGPSTTMHVRVGRLPQQLKVASTDIEVVGCTAWDEQPRCFSPRHGTQILQIEMQQATATFQFDACAHKKPKAVGVWVHSADGNLPAFGLTLQAGTQVLQSAAFERGEPSDSVWTYMEAPVSGDFVQNQPLKIGVTMVGTPNAQFAVDSFRLVYDYIADDLRIPEIKRISIRKHAHAGDNESLHLTAYSSVDDLLPCLAPIDCKRFRILIDETEYTGLTGYYGINKGASSLMLHNFPISRGVHRVRVCAQTYDGNQVWADTTFDTDQLETMG